MQHVVKNEKRGKVEALYNGSAGSGDMRCKTEATVGKQRHLTVKMGASGLSKSGVMDTRTLLLRILTWGLVKGF